MERSGAVIRKQVAAGSKSDRPAVLLQTPDNEYVLRIQGGNPFHDPRLEALVGKRIRARGEVHGYTFLMHDWTEE
jgi:hypothetical protein